MRHLVLSDIHGNLEALTSVLENTKTEKIDHYLILGDIVGYGAAPNEVVDKIRSLQPKLIVRGNHDKVCSGVEDGENFNYIAKDAAHWTRKQLSVLNYNFLKELPQGPVNYNGSIILVHGTPQDEDGYITSKMEAYNTFRYGNYWICFHGHSHINGSFILGNSSIDFYNSNESVWGIFLESNNRYLINPGSVGQPRDRNNKASCAIFDDEEGFVKIMRFEYDLKSSQERILNNELHQSLANRLEIGA